MKDCLIRIENGHHVVDMNYKPNQLELAMKNTSEGFKQLGETINIVLEISERIVNGR